MQIGDCYERNGITIQIDDIIDGVVYFAKYKAHIGDRGNWDNFIGFYRMPVDNFTRQLGGER